MADRYFYMQYMYMLETEYLEDNTKYYHLVENLLTKVVYVMPVSVYTKEITEERFTKWIDMEMPNQLLLSGRTEKNFNDYYEIWAQKQLEKAFELENI